MIYGAEPVNLGIINLEPTEMMFWMYCPIKLPGTFEMKVPENLRWCSPLITAACLDFNDFMNSKGYGYDKYVYLTTKTLWVSGEYIGNRPGWHSDGFGTDDLNYIWYDRAPTEFMIGSFTLPEDCEESIEQMEYLATEPFGPVITTFSPKTLLKLDQRMIHRCPVNFEPGMRTFVKISVSKDPYDLIGNSVNPHFGEIFDKKSRQETRNHPSSRTKL